MRTLPWRLDLAPVAWLAHSDTHQLENALLNLVINGRDAMPAGGELCIATTTLSLDAEAAARESLTPGDYVRLSVTDTGTGMPPEVKAKAFEPFFTTKPAGQGTGLGLSMIYGFVKQSGGTARIDTEQGQGTTISLYLPRHAEVAAAAQEQSTTKVAPRAEAGQTVLVVEDEYAACA
ncbi:signal transduction histidine kinase [Pseudomonas psychrotolerans]|nr:signal transduction histidine kinase [Pseudomonas psychrotolerans]